MIFIFYNFIFIFGLFSNSKILELSKIIFYFKISILKIIGVKSCFILSVYSGIDINLNNYFCKLNIY